MLISVYKLYTFIEHTIYMILFFIRVLNLKNSKLIDISVLLIIKERLNHTVHQFIYLNCLIVYGLTKTQKCILMVYKLMYLM